MSKFVRFYTRQFAGLAKLSGQKETVAVVMAHTNKHGTVKIQPVLDGIYGLPNLHESYSVVVKNTKKEDLFQLTSSIPVGQLLDILKERHRLEILSGDLK